MLRLLQAKHELQQGTRPRYWLSDETTKSLFSILTEESLKFVALFITYSKNVEDCVNELTARLNWSTIEEKLLKKSSEIEIDYINSSNFLANSELLRLLINEHLVSQASYRVIENLDSTLKSDPK